MGRRKQSSRVNRDSTSPGGPGDGTRVVISRRDFIKPAGAAGLLLVTAEWKVLAAERASLREPSPEFWWFRYPTYVDVGPSITTDQALAWHARMLTGDYVSDPTWGPYARRLGELESPANFAAAKKAGLRWIAWVEAFGDCLLYAVALERRPDGSFPGLEGHPQITRQERSAWCWEAEGLKRGNTFRWVGPHNTVNDEDFVQPLFTRERTGLPIPRYPDGREAVGFLPDGQYPVNARLYDACCSKDINGNVDLALDSFPPKANETDPDTGKPRAPTEGLYRVVVDRNQRDRFLHDQKIGDAAYCSSISIGKDIAAPFWTEYIRACAREIVRLGVDGFWCDNYSPWDNFGQFNRAFGDWSEHRFREFLRDAFSKDELTRMGIADAGAFDVRGYFKRKASEFGATDPSYFYDPKWSDPRWLDDSVWNAYKVLKQKVGRQGLRNFYHAIKDEARKAGRPDFLVSGNDMPVFGLGWAREDYLDMVSTEGTPGWHLTTGSRGIMIPPLGKYAVVYRAALEHQKGPYCTVWYSLQGPYEKYRGRPEIARVLMAEAFANNTFMKFGGNPAFPGTPEAVAWWNGFVTRHERQFGRRRVMADVGILFSPDNQLWLLTPGGPPDFDRQPHSFGHWGFATAVIDAHLPYRVVTDWKLHAAALKGLRAFVIPDAECLDDSALPLLENWVRAGGRLVVTGPSGRREGTAGCFRRRTNSLLSSLVGVDIASEAAAPHGQAGGVTAHTGRLGRGTVVWTPAPVGMEYYLREKERPALLTQIAEMVGASPLLDGSGLSPRVGVFCWASPDEGARFADLVNYDLDADADRVTPVENLRFKIGVPRGWKDVEVTTLSPNDAAPATATVREGWAVVDLPRLVHYASVRLAPK